MKLSPFPRLIVKVNGNVTLHSCLSFYTLSRLLHVILTKKPDVEQSEDPYCLTQHSTLSHLGLAQPDLAKLRPVN